MVTRRIDFGDIGLELPPSMPNEAEHSPATTPKPSTQPCYVCDGFGSRANEEAYIMMHTEPCTFCEGTGKLDMLGRALTSSKVP